MQHPKDQASTSQGMHTTSSNAHGIIFRNRAQQDKSYMLVERKIVNTRYIDDSIIQTLGLFDDIHWMLDRVWWTQFANMKFPTYEKITSEFLSVIEANILYGFEWVKVKLLLDNSLRNITLH